MRYHKIYRLSQAMGTGSDRGVRILNGIGGLEEAANLIQGVALKRKGNNKQDCFLLFS